MPDCGPRMVQFEACQDMIKGLASLGLHVPISYILMPLNGESYRNRYFKA